MAGGAGAVSIGANLILNGSQIWSNGPSTPVAVSGPVSGVGNLTTTGNFAISGTIINIGAGTLTVNAGTLTLSGANTFTGITTVNSGGIVNYQSGIALGTNSTITVNSGGDRAGAGKCCRRQ